MTPQQKQEIGTLLIPFIEKLNELGRVKGFLVDVSSIMIFEHSNFEETTYNLEFKTNEGEQIMTFNHKGEIVE